MRTIEAASGRANKFPAWLQWFAPAPTIAAIQTEAAAIEAGYRSWRKRILVSSIIGYATFYFVRKNLSVAMPVMEKALGISKTDLGLFLTLHGLLYGVSKFANGYVGDRANARTFMAFGLICSAIMNICFGLSSAVVTLGMFWLITPGAKVKVPLARV